MATISPLAATQTSNEKEPALGAGSFATASDSLDYFLQGAESTAVAV